AGRQMGAEVVRDRQLLLAFGDLVGTRQRDDVAYHRDVARIGIGRLVVTRTVLAADEPDDDDREPHGFCASVPSGADPVMARSPHMAYVVADPCVKCKYTDCVAVCPVDCFYEGKNSLAINPDECIDCGACEPECPTTAIFEESELPSKWA